MEAQAAQAGQEEPEAAAVTAPLVEMEQIVRYTPQEVAAAAGLVDVAETAEYTARAAAVVTVRTEPEAMDATIMPNKPRPLADMPRAAVAGLPVIPGPLAAAAFVSSPTRS